MAQKLFSKYLYSVLHTYIAAGRAVGYTVVPLQRWPRSHAVRRAHIVVGYVVMAHAAMASPSRRPEGLHR